MDTRFLVGSDAVDFVTNSARPIVEDGVVTNSFLSLEEWSKLDKKIIQAAERSLGAWADVMNDGLTEHTSLAEEFSKWRVSSEVTDADVTMDFRTRIGQDKVDMKTYGVPIPIISKGYSFGRREVLVARASGADLQTVNAEEAARAVSEGVESLLVNGNTNIVVQGMSIPGYTSLAARDQDTAAGYGGGDFGTFSDIYPTFTGMMSKLAAKDYYGPFRCYVANTQYYEMLALNSETERSALANVLDLPEIESVRPNALLADGSLVMVQMTSNVVNARIALDLENRQWEAPDGSALFYSVMMAAAPRLVTDYNGNTGIAHATSC